MGEPRSAPLIQVFFSGQLSDEEILAKFEGYAVIMRAILAQYEQVPGQIAPFQDEVASPREHFFWMLTLDNGIRGSAPTWNGPRASSSASGKAGSRGDSKDGTARYPRGTTPFHPPAECFKGFHMIPSFLRASVSSRRCSFFLLIISNLIFYRLRDIRESHGRVHTGSRSCSG
jgi:hypothetical protein